MKVLMRVSPCFRAARLKIEGCCSRVALSPHSKKHRLHSCMHAFSKYCARTKRPRKVELISVRSFKASFQAAVQSPLWRCLMCSATEVSTPRACACRLRPHSPRIRKGR